MGKRGDLCCYRSVEDVCVRACLCSGGGFSKSGKEIYLYREWARSQKLCTGKFQGLGHEVTEFTEESPS